MKTSSELRTEARNNLSKKFGEAIVISLLYFAITSAISFWFSFTSSPDRDISIIFSEKKSYMLRITEYGTFESKEN